MRSEKTERLLASKTHGLICKCEQCGIDFKPKSGAIGRFCSKKCDYQSKRDQKLHGRHSYFNCCKCHAALGFGIYKSAQFVGKEKGNIAKGMRALKIQRYQPEGGSWQVSAAILKRNEAAWKEAWMSEYNPKFPDWWSVYAIERRRKMTCERQKELHRTLPKEHPWRLKKVCRTRIYHAIKRSNVGAVKRKANRTTQLIGCSMEQLRSHLESKFKPGMTWENHGNGWHIDHIIPCAAFDFTNPDQIFQCFHYTNLQPLWAHENLSKSDKIVTTQMNLRLPYSPKQLSIKRLAGITPL